MKSVATRICIGLMFLLVAWVYSLTAIGNNYPAVYLIEAAIDTVIVCALPLFGKSSLVTALQKINLASVAIHLYGWAIYMAYLPPLTYDASLTIIVCLQWARLFWATHDDTNNSNNNFRCDSFLYACFGVSRINQKGKN
jgi:hypothetical protein